MSTCVRTASTDNDARRKPREGVRPPSSRPLQSSTRSAPPCAAATTLPIVPQQTSKRGRGAFDVSCISKKNVSLHCKNTFFLKKSRTKYTLYTKRTLTDCFPTPYTTYKPTQTLHKVYTSIHGSPTQNLNKPYKSIHKPYKSIRKAYKSIRKPYKSIHKPCKSIRKPYKTTCYRWIILLCTNKIRQEGSMCRHRFHLPPFRGGSEWGFRVYLCRLCVGFV